MFKFLFISVALLATACTNSFYQSRLADDQITKFNLSYYGYDKRPIFVPANNLSSPVENNVREYHAYDEQGDVLAIAYAYGTDPNQLSKLRLKAYLPKDKKLREQQMRSFSFFNLETLSPGVLLATFMQRQLSVPANIDRQLAFMKLYFSAILKASEQGESLLSYNGKDMRIEFRSAPEMQDKHAIIFTFTLWPNHKA